MNVGDYVVVEFEPNDVQAAVVCAVAQGKVEVNTEISLHSIISRVEWVPETLCARYSKGTLETLGLVA